MYFEKYLDFALQRYLQECGLEMPDAALEEELIKTANILIEKLSKQNLVILLSSLIQTADDYANVCFDLSAEYGR